MNTARLATAAGLLLSIVGGVGLGIRLGPGEAPSREQGNPEMALNAWLKETEQSYRSEPSEEPLAFPRDHGAHPDTPLESWEFLGSLATADGRRFGFQWSLLRLGLGPGRPERKSAWATQEVYRGVLALSDPAGIGFRGFERFSRSAALGLAGSDNRMPPRIWLEDWALSVPTGADGDPEFMLQAKSDDTAVELRLRTMKPPLYLGQDESSEALGGRLRGYWSSRLRVEGRVDVAGVIFPVDGQAWFDHVWGKVLLPGGQTALNRFRLQLDDGREILIFQVHRRDGSADPLARGFWIDPNGYGTPIEREGLVMAPMGYWESRTTHARYPVRWKLSLPRETMELELLPLLEDQEIRGSRRAWSGTVSIRGRSGSSKPVSGNGFVELTGY